MKMNNKKKTLRVEGKRNKASRPPIEDGQLAGKDPWDIEKLPAAKKVEVLIGTITAMNTRALHLKRPTCVIQVDDEGRRVALEFFTLNPTLKVSALMDAVVFYALDLNEKPEGVDVYDPGFYELIPTTKGKTLAFCILHLAKIILEIELTFGMSCQLLQGLKYIKGGDQAPE